MRIEPIASFSLSVRATALTVHPLHNNSLLLGFEDGSIRTVHLEEKNGQLHFHVMNVMKPQLSWFENTPIRSIVVDRCSQREFVICDEVWTVFECKCSEGVCSYGIANPIQAAFVRALRRM